MKTMTLKSSVEALAVAAEKLKAIAPHFIFIAGARDKLENTAALKEFAAQFTDAQIIGCSTSGEIDNNGVSDKGLVIAAAHFDRSRVRTASVKILPGTNEREAGIEIAKKLLAPDLKGIFILGPGVGVNSEAVVQGFLKILPPNVVLSGGLAGDGINFRKTQTMLNGELFDEHIIAVGFYGEQLMIGAGSRGGWRTFGPARRVTRVRDNILYELDGKPALDLYKKYLGEKASGLPATGMPYPLAILGDDLNATGLIRSVKDVDHESRSLILGGSIPHNSFVCLMHANNELLAQGAADAAQEAMGEATTNNEDSLSLLVSCVGRRSVMGENTDDEIEAALNVLGIKAKICGFYSYGEICPFIMTGKPELHNQTMTITHIYERMAGQ